MITHRFKGLLLLLACLIATPVPVTAQEAKEVLVVENPESDKSEKSKSKKTEKAKSIKKSEKKKEDKKPEATKKSAAERVKEARAKAAKERALRAKERAARKAAEKKAQESKTARYASFTLSGAIPESPGGSGPFSDLSTDLRKLIVRLDKVANDDSLRGVVLHLREVALGGGQRHEIRQAIGRIRAAGKHVVADMEVATGGSYLIASACDEIIMPESGFLHIPGIRAEPLFYKGLLAKVGVEADFVHVGDAKGAAEPYTRKAWSKPVKKNITSLVDDMFDQMIDTIAMERPMSRQAVVDAIDQGLMTATEAKKIGLIDHLAYEGEIRGMLKEHQKAEKVTFVKNYGKKKVDTDFSGPAGFFKLLGMMAGGGDKSSSRGKKIAVVYAVGPIMTGESESDLFGNSSTMGSTTIVKALHEANEDENVAAIVLRVNSPGGSAVASDIIWSKIQQIEKPVIASMSDVAASGGYYISMGADKVFAEPTTVTGSIGVVGGKMAVGRMMKKLGVTHDLISRGENSGLFSPYQKFTDSERKALVDMMEDTYDQFTAKAAEGRGLTQDRIKELGGGRVYTGRQAEELRLIDKLGDLRDAVAEAKKMADIDSDESVKIVTYPKQEDFFESLFGKNEEQKEVRMQVQQALSLGGASPELLEATQRLALMRKMFGREPVVMLTPFELHLAQ